MNGLAFAFLLLTGKIVVIYRREGARKRVELKARLKKVAAVTTTMGDNGSKNGLIPAYPYIHDMIYCFPRRARI